MIEEERKSDLQKNSAQNSKQSSQAHITREYTFAEEPAEEDKNFFQIESKTVAEDSEMEHIGLSPVNAEQ